MAILCQKTLSFVLKRPKLSRKSKSCEVFLKTPKIVSRETDYARFHVKLWSFISFLYVLSGF